MSKVPKLRFKGFISEWPNKTLEDVAVIARGKSRHRPRDASFLYGGPYPFIQTGDIRTAELYITSFTQTYSEEGLKQSRLWDEGTLCITIAANIAETAILKIKACFPDSVIGLLPKEGESDTLFIKYLFDKFKIEIQSLSQGLAQANLNLEKLSSLKFSIPSLPEQQKIASFLSAVDQKIQQLTRKKEWLEQYKKGVMQQLFSGKLRFKDPNGKPYPKWEEKKLGDISTINTGASNRQDSGLDGEFVFFDRSEDIRTSSRYLFDGEAVIVPGEGQDFIPKYFVGKFDLHQRTYAVMNFKDLSGKYLFYFIYQSQKHFLAHAVGSTVKSLRMPIFEKLVVKVPCDEEQQKIANFLTALDAKIESVAAQVSKVQEFKKGLLQQMFV